MGSLRSWTYEEIAKHNKADDCWLVIHDHVYDVTRFVPHHPGGNMIYLNAGRESTRLFESYHPDKVKPLLQKYLIGTVKGSNTFRVQFANDKEDHTLYERIKTQVMQHLQDKKIDPRFSLGMYVKSFLIFAFLILSYYFMHFFPSSFWVSAVGAVFVGFFTAEVGISIQHDANHGGYHKNPSINKWIGVTLDIVGASSFVWKQQHVFGHHVYTNIDGIDPDIRVKDPDVRRTTYTQPWRLYHVYQHLYLGLLYGLLAIKSIFHDDFSMIAHGYIGVIPVNHIHLEEKIVFVVGKAFYFIYYLLIPALFSHHSLMESFELWIIAQLITGWVLAFSFQVNHVTEGADFYKTDDDSMPIGWTRSQIEGTSDFAHGSWFWTNVTGGLNYQVVHHLFPWICHMHYPEIAPIIKDICKKEGIKYVVYPTFLSALQAHFRHMQNTGKGAKVR